MWLERLQAHRILMNAVQDGWLVGYPVFGWMTAPVAWCSLRLAMRVGGFVRWLSEEGAHLLVCSDLSCSTISGDLGGDLTQLVAERPCVLSGGPRGSCRCRGSGPACHGMALLSVRVLGVLLA